MGTPRDVQVVLAHADPGVRRRFTRVLSHVGHHVVAVDAVDAAVERCRERPPDVVLVDAALCRDDEQELLAALKGDPEAYRSAVVLLERHAREAGVRTIRLETNRALSEAIALYRTSGYREVERFNDEVHAHHWFAKSLG